MTTLEQARAYVAAGLSVIPVRADGSKAPAIPAWKEYQQRRATNAELEKWFGGGTNGIAIICGRVSGNLEVLDFDCYGAYLAWSEAIASKCPGLVKRLTEIETPAGGRHIYYRLPEAPKGNQKLARDASGKTTIETRGEGGYVLAPGCPPSCHPIGKVYRHISGPELTEIQTIEGDAH